MLKRNISRGILFSLFAGILFSCSPYFHQPLGVQEAELGPETPLKKELLGLPEPKEKIVVAVYKFRDQTGQYKPSETGASWSTAITQGATNILIRALEESGWFIPIERENISNLLNERKIIRSSREQYEGGSQNLLPPLLFAGVLIEGGVVSYETNVFTGGAGVRYFGTDVSSQYREDRVSIYLRAVSTSNGKILKTIYTTKSILSQEVSAGVFRYVKYKRLLEAETGYTYNEPTEMAITEAIEKALYGLIIEGVNDNLWALKDTSRITSDVFRNYQKEKEASLNQDAIGRDYTQSYRGKHYINFMGAGQLFNGDYSRGDVTAAGTTGFGFAIVPSLFLEARFGAGQLNIKDNGSFLEYAGDLNLVFLANTRERYSPYASFGAGALYDFGDYIGLSEKSVIPYLSFTGGMEYMFSKKVGINGEMFYNHFLSDYYDGSKTGTFNDGYWGLKLGLKIYY